MSLAGFTAVQIRIRQVTAPDDPALDAAYTLLRREFSREERVSLSDWRGTLAEVSSGLLTDVAWHLFVAEQDGTVVGLASGSYLGDVNYGVIGYLALSPGMRSRGIGTRLRHRLRREFERDAIRINGEPLRAVLGEVSLGNRWLRTLAARRNILLLDFTYYQPELYENDEPSRFVLYYESLHDAPTSIPVKELRRFLYTLWRRVYRVARPLEHPSFRAMLRSFGKRRVVGPLELPVTRKRVRS